VPPHTARPSRPHHLYLPFCSDAVPTYPPSPALVGTVSSLFQVLICVAHPSPSPLTHTPVGRSDTHRPPPRVPLLLRGSRSCFAAPAVCGGARRTDACRPTSYAYMCYYGCVIPTAACAPPLTGSLLQCQHPWPIKVCHCRTPPVHTIARPFLNPFLSARQESTLASHISCRLFHRTICRRGSCAVDRHAHNHFG
jgi:hypothetical protein